VIDEWTIDALADCCRQRWKEVERMKKVESKN
jgi:hypothetical protein